MHPRSLCAPRCWIAFRPPRSRCRAIHPWLPLVLRGRGAIPARFAIAFVGLCRARRRRGEPLRLAATAATIRPRRVLPFLSALPCRMHLWFGDDASASCSVGRCRCPPGAGRPPPYETLHAACLPDMRASDACALLPSGFLPGPGDYTFERSRVSASPSLPPVRASLGWGAGSQAGGAAACLSASRAPAAPSHVAALMSGVRPRSPLRFHPLVFEAPRRSAVGWVPVVLGAVLPLCSACFTR